MPWIRFSKKKKSVIPPHHFFFFTFRVSETHQRTPVLWTSGTFSLTAIVFLAFFTPLPCGEKRKKTGIYSALNPFLTALGKIVVGFRLIIREIPLTISVLVAFLRDWKTIEKEFGRFYYPPSGGPVDCVGGLPSDENDP